jgi:hypothetical protein
MSSIIKVDQIQLADGSTPTAGDLGFNTTGSVLQVVQTHTDAQPVYSYGTNTFGEITELATSITPSNVNNKILVIPQIVYGTAYDSQPIFKMKRDSLDISVSTNSYDSARLGSFASYARSANPNTEAISVFTASFMYLDSPSSTTEVTYKILVNNRGTDAKGIILNAPSLYTDWNDANASALTSTVTLMEIAG